MPLNATMALSKSNSNRTDTARRRQFCSYCLTLVFLSMLTLRNYPAVINSLDNSVVFVPKINDIITLPLKPKTFKDHFYMLPKKAEDGIEREKGILILFHSCKRSGLSFFHLPEERIVVKDALKRGLAVLAPTSKLRETGCWTQTDLASIDTEVDEWADAYNLTHVPRLGMGDSSGGSFLYFVYKSLKLKSMAAYNSPQSFHPDDVETNLVIPTALLSMTADENLSSKIKLNYDKLRSVGVSSQLYSVTSHPFTPAICTARFPEFESDDCSNIFDTIKYDFKSILDRRFFVKKKGSTILTSSQWDKFFSMIDIDYDSALKHYLKDELYPGHDWINYGIRQELKACQGFHAFTSENHAKILDFLTVEAGIS